MKLAIILTVCFALLLLVGCNSQTESLESGQVVQEPIVYTDSEVPAEIDLGLIDQFPEEDIGSMI